MDTSTVAARTSRTATDGHKNLERLARAGYAAKGVVYATTGILAASSAFGWFSGGDVGGTKNAVREIASQPFGNVLLGLLVVGLAGYVVWRFAQAIKDTEGKGGDAKGIAQRVGLAISGTTYALLALYAARLAGWIGGGGGSGGGSGQKQQLLGRVMSNSWGPWLVGAVGLVVIGVGGYQFRRAVTKSFKKNWRTAGMSSGTEEAVTRFAQAGIVARAITFVLIGIFIVQGAVTTDPSKVEGLGQVLYTLREQPYGPWLMGAVGIGLALYGLYCFVNARYRTIRTR